MDTDPDIQTLCENEEPFQDIDIQADEFTNFTLNGNSHTVIVQLRNTLMVTTFFLLVWILMEKIGG